MLIGMLEWASLNTSCWLSNSMPLLAPIFLFLRAMMLLLLPTKTWWWLTVSCIAIRLIDFHMLHCFVDFLWFIFCTTYSCYECLLLTQLRNFDVEWLEKSRCYVSQKIVYYYYPSMSQYLDYYAGRVSEFITIRSSSNTITSLTATIDLLR